MVSVPSEWITIHNQIITTESDIWLYFYPKSNSLTPSAIIKGYQISSFSFNQSGSVINSIYPKKEIVFEMFNFRAGTPEFDIGQDCCVVIKYKKLDGSGWLDCVIGSFKITNKEITANGLTARYTMDNLFKGNTSNRLLDTLLTTNYEKGSNMYGNNPNDDATLNDVLRMAGFDLMDLEHWEDLPVGKSLPSIPLIDTLQMCSLCGGRTLKIGVDDTNITPYNNKVSYEKISDDTLGCSSDYIVKEYFCFMKPEISTDYDVKTLIIREYQNAKMGYNITDPSNLINAERFGVGDYEYIQPDKYWCHNYVDRDDNHDYYVSGNKIYATPNTGSGYVIYAEMKTTYVENWFNISSTGEEMTIDNVLINENYVVMAKDYLVKWLSKNQVLEISGRFDPRLEVFDKINVLYQGFYYTIVVERVNFEYNGGFSGRITGRIIEKGDTKAPVLIERTINGANDFSIKIQNLTDTQQTLFIYWSQQIDEITIAPFDYITIEAGDYGYFDQAVSLYLDERLDMDVYCYFEYLDINTIILEANN